MDQNAQPIEDAEIPEVEDTSEETLEEQDSGQPDAQEVEPKDEVEEVDGEDESPETEDEDSQELKFEKLAEIAEALELEPDAFLESIQTTVKVNGEEIPVTLKELHSGYQKDADYRQKTSEIAENRRQFEEVVNNLNSKFSERIEEIEALSTSLEEAFMEDFKSIDWQKIRQEDPANYAALQHDMDQKKQFITNAKLKVHMEKEKQQEEFQKNLREKVIPEERAKLADFNQDWKSDEHWNKDYKDILTNMVNTYGFRPEEVNSIVDSRALRVAWDALRFNSIQSKKEDGVNQIKKKVALERKKLSKKVLKPGGAQQRVSGKSKRMQAAQAKLKKSGSVEDAAALLLEQFNSR